MSDWIKSLKSTSLRHALVCHILYNYLVANKWVTQCQHTEYWAPKVMLKQAGWGCVGLQMPSGLCLLPTHKHTCSWLLFFCLFGWVFLFYSCSCIILPLHLGCIRIESNKLMDRVSGIDVENQPLNALRELLCLILPASLYNKVLLLRLKTCPSVSHGFKKRTFLIKSIALCLCLLHYP